MLLIVKERMKNTKAKQSAKLIPQLYSYFKISF